mgnify:CR=1 FL=1
MFYVFFFNDTATTEIYTDRSSAASDVYKRQVQLFTVSLQSKFPGYPGYYYRDVNFGNYLTAVVDYWPHFARSLLYAGLATLLAFILAYPLAYAMAFKAGKWLSLINISEPTRPY